MIRSVVVFGRSPADRSQQTGLSARTIYRWIERFDQLGIQSIVDVKQDTDSKWCLPAVVSEPAVVTT